MMPIKIPRHLCILAIAAFYSSLLFLGTSPLLAKGQMQVRVANSSDSPISISACSIRSYDDIDYHLEPDVGLINLSGRDVVGIRIALTFFNHDAIDGDVALGPPVLITWPRNGDASLKPGAATSYHDAIGQVRYRSSSFVQCSIFQVRFADGSTWSHVTRTPAAISPSPAPMSPTPYHSRLPGGATSIDVAGRPCAQSTSIAALHVLSDLYRSGKFAELEGQASSLIQWAKGCESTSVGADFAYANWAEALGHGWRADALVKEARTLDAIEELKVQLAVEQPLLENTNLTSEFRVELRKNYDAASGLLESLRKKTGNSAS